MILLLFAILLKKLNEYGGVIRYQLFSLYVVDNRLILPIAIEAIGKQVPMKPEYEGDGYDDNGELDYDTAYCPRCRRSYEVGYEDGHPFCDECGQALDWEAEK